MLFLVLILTTGGCVYLMLSVIAAIRYLEVPPPKPATLPISILKPLAGADLGLEENLRSFFQQDYAGPCEILFATRTSADPALPIVRQLQAEFPHVPSQILEVGEPPYANAKVWSLEKLTQAARHDLLAMADSDIRVSPAFLATVAAEFADPAVDLATCPYRAIGGPSLWSRLEAAGLNTEFIGGLLVARMLEGVRFAVGPTIVVRRPVLAAIGGFPALSRYLAEDFVMGQWAAEKGFGVILSRYVIEHRIGSEPLAKNFAHRLRWNRSTRRSRPAGYVGQVFMNPLPWAMMLAFTAWWPLAVFAILLRILCGIYLSARVLGAPWIWLTLPQDFLSLLFWVLGFWGNTITWRDRRYRLHPDGTFTLVPR
ncbi:MAG: glycosyltransferase [Bryobacteraceae bacterium]|nr:glycosyltransferase [Bryobacteraceae bacterium]